jgi:uncharacterized protein (DUF952 family)
VNQVDRVQEPATIYKICPAALWQEAQASDVFRGAPVDRHDGFIHFSAAQQVTETAARYFASQDGLLLIAVDAFALGEKLRWEVARNGERFPHLYGDLTLTAVRWVKPLPLVADGRHVFPDLEGKG